MVGGNESGPNSEINFGRKLLAITGDAKTVRAIREWMVWEKSTEVERDITRYEDGKMHTCGKRDDRIGIYYRLRQSIRGDRRGWFDWLPWIAQGKKLSPETVWEVFNRCLYPDRG